MSNYHGILNVDKPEGWTSHDVVGKVRRILGQRSVGHAGTLDPLATGVLLVCVGQATRVAEYLAGTDKVYEATVRLGVTTDTYASDGEVLSTSPVPDLSTADVEAALRPFLGDIEQAPPAYSAIKKDGVPLYKRARRGEEVELRPRPVTIHGIDVLAWQSPDVDLRVKCGPGTYIRSLAYDLGRRLGCGATLARLVRVRSGAFDLANSVSIERLAADTAQGAAARHLHPLADALSGLTSVPVDQDAALRLLQGQSIACTQPSPGPLGYALNQAGEAVAILTYDAERNVWRPKKVFAQ